jgi:hypothetical protein
MIAMARRVAAPPPWLAAHTSRLSAAARDVLLAEAEATLAQVHGCRLIPSLVQAEGYFRAVAFAGTTDRIGVSYTILGCQLESGDVLHDLWARIQTSSAAGPAHSRAILEQHLATLS